VVECVLERAAEALMKMDRRSCGGRMPTKRGPGRFWPGFFPRIGNREDWRPRKRSALQRAAWQLQEGVAWLRFWFNGRRLKSSAKVNITEDGNVWSHGVNRRHGGSTRLGSPTSRQL